MLSMLSMLNLPKNKKNVKNVKMYFVENVSFLRVAGQMDIRFEISIKSYIFQHGTIIFYDIFSHNIYVEGLLFSCPWVSRLIVGIKLFRPPRATRTALLFVCCCLFVVVPCCTRLNKRLHRECNFWKVIITTLKYFGFVVVSSLTIHYFYHIVIWYFNIFNNNNIKT